MSEARSYPRHTKTDGGDIEFRLMSRADEAPVLAFAQKLPTHDLLFLPRNISQPKVLSAWEDRSSGVVSFWLFPKMHVPLKRQTNFQLVFRRVNFGRRLTRHYQPCA